MPNDITISGFKEFGEKMNQLAVSFPQDLDDAAKFAAQTWEKGAKQAAPVNFGFLRSGISSYQVSSGVWEVASSKFYSPYNEWGTVTRVNVPAELADYALQFKGRGIIKTGGMFPQPFFFIQRPAVEAQLIGDLKQMIETI